MIKKLGCMACKQLNRKQISRGRGDGVGGNGLFEIAGCFSTVEDIYIFILTGKE